MSFKYMIFLTTIIIFFITLFFLWYILTSRNQLQWPPIIANCPDYWEDQNGDGSKCVNKHKMGICAMSSPNTIDFNKIPYNSSNGKCAKYTWAKNCKVTWDGVTTQNKNPCSDTTNNL